MPSFPTSPVPAHTSVATIEDPVYTSRSDAGYIISRSRYPRPRRMVQVDYLGLTTLELRVLQNFVAQQRLSALPFDYYSVRNYDIGTIQSTTPIIVSYNHPYVTGQWVWVGASSVPGVDGLYPITVINAGGFALNNTIARGSGTAHIRMYFPTAVLRSDDGTLPGATKLIGPEAVQDSRGRFSWSLMVEERF